MNRLYATLLAGAVMTAAAAVSSTAYAADVAGIIHDGESITIDRSEKTHPVYEIIPDTDCTLQIATNWSNPMLAGHTGSSLLYTSSNHEVNDDANIDERVPCDWSMPGAEGYDYYYNLKGGVHYYFYYAGGAYIPDPNQPKTVTFTFNFLELQAPAVTIIDPAPDADEYYNVLKYPELQMMFSAWGSFTFGSDTNLTYVTEDGATASVPLDYSVVSDGKYVAWKVRNALRNASAAPGGIKEGSVFTLNITSPKIDGISLAGDYVNVQGNIVLQYKYRKVTTTTLVEYPNPFLSYWPETSENGIFKLVFDNDLLPLDSYGNRERATFSIFAGPYREPSGDGNDEGWPQLEGAPMVIDGNTLTVDLRGVIRPSENQTAALQVLKETPIVSMWVQNLLDIDGNNIDFDFGPVNGALVQVNDVPFIQFNRIDPVYEFTPESSQNKDVSLTDVNSVELWISEETADVVTITGFEFIAGEEVIATVDVEDTDPTADEGMVYTIPVPAAVQKTPGEIFLSAVCSSDDGYTYEIRARYFNEGIQDPDPVPADTFDYEVSLLTPSSDMVFSAVGASVSWGLFTELTLCEGAHAELYVNSDFMAEPEDLGTLVAADLEVDVIDVTLREGGGVAQAEGDTEIPDYIPNGLYIKLPDEAFFMKGVFNIVIPEGTVMDAEGKVNPATTVTFWVVDAYTGGDICVSPEVGNYQTANVNTLPLIEISFEGASNVEINPGADFHLNQTPLAPYAEAVYNDETGDVIGYTFDVSSLTAEQGVYELIISDSAFIIDYMYLNGVEFIGTYNVLSSTAIESAIAPEEGRYTVYGLNGILVLDTDNAALLRNLEPGFYIINGQKVIVRK